MVPINPGYSIHLRHKEDKLILPQGNHLSSASSRMDSPMIMETHKLLSEKKDQYDMPNSASFADQKLDKSKFLRPRMGSRRIRNRLVQKYGICNISLVNVPKQHRKYFTDVFTTIIEAKWRWCLLFFSLSFFLSWSLFTAVYYMLVLYHGDFEHLNDADWVPCIQNGNSLLNIFLFAFTTQTTIGYGFRYPTDACPLVVMTMCVQFMVGVMCQTLMAGVIFAKLARPIKRAATILFSKNAVICQRDGKLCLLFRVGDMRKSSLAEAHIRLQMIKKCVTEEGEVLPFHQFDMNVGYDSGLDRVFVIWPITICHEIDESSPLYEMSKEGLATARFEIIAILEGVVESVGSTTQARTSYLPNEILWGKRFEKLVTYQRENGEYRIDFGKFHNVYDVATPTCSAKDLDELQDSQAAHENGYRGSQQLSVSEHYTHDEEHRLTVKDGADHVIRNRLNSNHKIVVELSGSDDDRDADDQREMLPRKRSLLRSESPGEEARRKQSFQVRRGPDLF